MRNPGKVREGIPQELFTDSSQEILEDPEIQIVIEVMGGIEPARTYVEEAMKAGKQVVTANKDLPQQARMDLLISLITLKYTQSNSVCYVQDGQTIGVGAGQQSRIHCTRLAGQKADNWQLRHMPKVLDLPFREDISKPNRDNAIDVYIGDTPEDVIGDDVWAETFTVQPAPLTAEEKKAWLSKVTNVALGSDAFFPFGDNIERARRSGVTAIVQPGGSIRDDQVIATCNKYGIAMAFCGIRLFHH